MGAIMGIVLPYILKLLARPKVILCFIAITTLVGTYYYIQYLQYRVESLYENQTKLELRLKENETIINNLKFEHDGIIESKRELTKLVAVLDNDKKELIEVLYRERKKKKSLEELAIKATEKVEYRVNKATKNVFRCIEIASGSEPKSEVERENFKNCNID